MLVGILYGMFILYIMIRIYLTLVYNMAKKRHSNLYYERMKTDIHALSRTSDRLDLKQMTKEWDEHHTTISINKEENKCRKVAKLDGKIKTAGSVVLGIAAIASLLFDYSGPVQQSSLLIVVLPGIVGLFNSTYEFFEIQLEFGFHPAAPKRYK